MQLHDMLAMTEDQDRGRWFDLLHPVSGKPTGMRIKLAGPDSATQARARILMADDLSDYADLDGRVSGEARETCRVRFLARCVLDWEVSEHDKILPLSFEAVIRLLRAGTWAQAQIDAIAADRRAFILEV